LPARIAAPDSIRSRLGVFIESEHIAFQFAISDDADLIVRESSQRRGSTLDELYCGGWIDCEVARAAAERLAIPKHDFGKLLDFLDVKVRNCALGCFD